MQTNRATIKTRAEPSDMIPEGESIKPDDEDVDGEDLGLDKTEGDEMPVEENDDEEA
jgi:hypothetical protein